MVDVVLPADPQEAEAECERVMAAVTQGLIRGRSVVLATVEAGGRTVRPVSDRIDLGRRLARALPSPTRAGSAGSVDAGQEGATVDGGPADDRPASPLRPGRGRR
jgi:hypothetical protein